MLFTQLAFALFFVLTWSGYWLLSRNHHRKLWLLAASYYFYGYWDYRFLALIGAFTLWNFAAAYFLGMTRFAERRKLVVSLAVIGNLSVLGFFKYFNFFVIEVASGLKAMGYAASIPSLNVVLPVGISFITFQAMSYTIDVYRRDVKQRGLLDIALFIAFFPQLVAGPIVRASDFLDQLDSKRFYEQVQLRAAAGLFLVGYFKKACVADNIAAAIDPLFNAPSLYSASSRVLGATLYSIQIYCDFSGYTDMAIATSALFGYQLVKNFDAPFLSLNIRDFWQRWHISLSTWLRDYLYIPLGGNRGTAVFVARNLMLTMLLGGLWHGANWTFLLWGFLHGFALVVQRAISDPRRTSVLAFPGKSLLSWALTFSWVVICFTIFRAKNIDVAWDYFTEFKASDLALRLWNGWWAITFALGAVHYATHRFRFPVSSRLLEMPRTSFCIGWGAAAGVCLYLTPLNLAPFIYFQF